MERKSPLLTLFVVFVVQAGAPAFGLCSRLVVTAAVEIAVASFESFHQLTASIHKLLAHLKPSYKVLDSEDVAELD